MLLEIKPIRIQHSHKRAIPTWKHIHTWEIAYPFQLMSYCLTSFTTSLSECDSSWMSYHFWSETILRRKRKRRDATGKLDYDRPADYNLPLVPHPPGNCAVSITYFLMFVKSYICEWFIKFLMYYLTGQKVASVWYCDEWNGF